MIVLGIIDSKPSSAAVLEGGEILAAVAEERLCRMKLANGTPREAVEKVMSVAGVSAAEIDAVAIAQNTLVFRPEPIPWEGWFKDDTEKTKRFARLSAELAPLVGRWPIAWKAHHGLKHFLSRERLTLLPKMLREIYGIQAPVTFYDHHHCHATTAYYTSGIDDALVITLDGGGDGLSGTVYAGRDGRLQRLATVDSFNSLGNFYSYATELCGFKAEKHEGKITGLAAVGEPIYAEILREFVAHEPPGQIRYKVPMYHSSALTRLRRRLPADFERAHLAASVQLVLEEIGVGFVDFWQRHTGLRNIVVAGGVFANVKFNQRIHELEDVDRFFVHPAMDDGGLSVGSALALLAEQDNGDPRDLQRRLPNVYLGPGYSDAAIRRAIEASGLAAEHCPRPHDAIAQRLAQGRVVARFTGRMEFGPRALGHRSILYTTTDPSVNDWLNEHLHRTEFMPFAPATLSEQASRCYQGLAGAEDPARFMTVTFDCTPEMQSTSPGVVHVDGTARPQLVDADTAPDLHGILQEYFRLTDIPSLINTSFNMHEEPIVCTPDDALRSFQQGNLDYLAIGDWLVEKPEPGNPPPSSTSAPAKQR